VGAELLGVEKPVILRTRAFPTSPTKRFPRLSPLTPKGVLSSTLVIGPPSPANPGKAPATVVIVPIESTTLILWLFVSAIIIFPSKSTETPNGLLPQWRELVY